MSSEGTASKQREIPKQVEKAHGAEQAGAVVRPND
ncbi:UNVERIFIED_ORG: hypothetical protein M2435_005025 [Rhizobium sophorae]|nr:hypothetical protein [Rhizobium leguminosarum]MBP2490980.1 hypothetical protein [Rhizobium leguminosarum]MDH6662102.1 hypothetical protein [Rhizobium sophorae]